MKITPAGNLSKIFFSLRNPNLKTEILELIMKKIAIETSKRNITDLVKKLPTEDKKICLDIFKKVGKLVEQCIEKQPNVIDYLLTNERFVNKCSERLQTCQDTCRNPVWLKSCIDDFEKLGPRLTPFDIKLSKVVREISKSLNFKQELDISLADMEKTMTAKGKILETECKYLYM